MKEGKHSKPAGTGGTHNAGGAGGKIRGILWQLRWFLLLIAEIALVLGIVRISRYRKETRASEETNRELAGAVTYSTPASVYPVSGDDSEEEKADDGSDAVSLSDDAERDLNRIPFTVDFDLLLGKNPDCVGWLLGEGTQINLAVMQAEDNTYYLFRTFDHVDNGYGTIFLDCNGSSDFRDANNLIYGHNMVNESMFGSLKHYQEQEYFENHRYLWLATRDKNYRLDVVAGLIHSDDSTLYSTPISRAATDELIPYAISNSVFETDAVYDPEARYLTLSTCFYEYHGSRFAVICKMVEVD